MTDPTTDATDKIKLFFSPTHFSNPKPGGDKKIEGIIVVEVDGHRPKQSLHFEFNIGKDGKELFIIRAYNAFDVVQSWIGVEQKTVINIIINDIAAGKANLGQPMFEVRNPDSRL